MRKIVVLGVGLVSLAFGFLSFQAFAAPAVTNNGFAKVDDVADSNSNSMNSDSDDSASVGATNQDDDSTPTPSVNDDDGASD